MSAPPPRGRTVSASMIARWRVISATVVEETVASDHLPVLVELELLPAPPEELPEP